ncbi:hypothetical protein [Gymnodinialimonas ceratoperidinii]|uniref:Uncharacterized protein n=1 Tax=Gymnodinialimonas ceratoperidinii TaxID=2856823 RepID=A0A8F6TWU7_9RHOB|nr:hypothetical protein [Gymnodinialimonas ceratoperidinii]QXT39389.1 hypothetical protein KYE46_15900 [Gymnodinialimonas ceratoperidinii]
MTPIRLFLQPHAFAVFFLCRVIGVVLRPLTLLVALTLPDGQFARDYALVLTAMVSSVVIYGNQNHRAVYAYFIGDTPQRRGLGGTRKVLCYIDGVAVHMILFAPPVGAVVWIWTESMHLWALVMALVVMEKFFDDHQRALIYQRRYLEWSAHFVFRTILPSGAILVMVLIFGAGSVTLYTALCLAFFLCYISLVSSKFTGVITAWALHVGREGVRGVRGRAGSYLKAYGREYLGAQVFSILAMNILLVDRYFVNAAFPETFASYVFAVNIFATLPLVHNIFHFTRIRPALMDAERPVLPTILSARNLLPPVALAVIALLSFRLLITLGWIESPLEAATLGWLALAYFLAAISMVAQEFVFWRSKRGPLVVLHAVLFMAMFAVLNILPPSVETIAMALVLILALRLVGLVWLSLSVHPRLRLPSSVVEECR